MKHVPARRRRMAEAVWRQLCVQRRWPHRNFAASLWRTGQLLVLRLRSSAHPAGLLKLSGRFPELAGQALQAELVSPLDRELERLLAAREAID